jgi:hypothetical protein
VTFGPDHPQVATRLEELAELLREEGRDEAVQLEARARAIRDATA